MAPFFDGNVNTNPPSEVNPKRYISLKLQDAEPNLGIPDEDSYVLTSDTDGVRSWVPFVTPDTFISNDIITNKGDIIIGLAPGEPTVVSVGVNGQILMADPSTSTGVKWETPVENIPESIIENKGDLIVGQSFSDAAILPVGNDGDILVADSSVNLGVKWDALVPSIPTSIIQSKGDVIVGAGLEDPEILPVGNDGDVLVADSNETLGVKWSTSAAPVLNVSTLTTDSLDPGQSQDLTMDLGVLFTIVSIGLASPPDDLWIRLYTTEGGMLSDIRVVPGPPFPSPNTGFAAEVVTSVSEPTIIFIPVLSLYSESGLYVRVTNQSSSTQVFEIEFKSLTTVQSI